eukprot:jgi/Chlat1/3901/Chrsp26S04181
MAHGSHRLQPTPIITEGLSREPSAAQVCCSEIAYSSTHTTADRIKGCHDWTISNYSLVAPGVGVDKRLQSDFFTVAGHVWNVQLYPDGTAENAATHVAVGLTLQSEAREVRALSVFTVIDQAGMISNHTMDLHDDGTPDIFSNPEVGHASAEYKTIRARGLGCRGFKLAKFIRRDILQRYLKDDTLKLRCVVEVVVPKSVPTRGQIDLPPSTLSNDLLELLSSGMGADCCFIAEGQDFAAHRWLLCARSTVFRAMLSSPMMESKARTIPVADIHAPVFRAVLHFMYSGCVPDEYVVANLAAVMATDGFLHLCASCPSLQAELLRMVALRSPVAQEAADARRLPLLCCNKSASGKAAMLARRTVGMGTSGTDG